MEALIGGVTILATLVGATYDRRLRTIMFGVAAVGASVLIMLGTSDVLPHPYTYLSLTCDQGFSPALKHEFYPFAIQEGGIAPWAYAFNEKDISTSAYCLVRNEGTGPVFNIAINFAYMTLPQKTASEYKEPDMKRGKVGEVILPHVGTEGAYITFQSLFRTIVFVAPTYTCSLYNPATGRRQACSLPPGDANSTSFVTQDPVALGTSPLRY